MRFRHVASAAAAAALLCVTLVVAPASAATWNFETLDGDSVTDGRRSGTVGRHSAALVYGGVPHVWYWDTDRGDLRHAWWGGTRWFYETLDGFCAECEDQVGDQPNRVGEYISAVVWNNEPHVFYYDATNGNLRHGWWTGRSWQFEDVDGHTTTNGRIVGDVGGHTTVTVWNNELHVFSIEDWDALDNNLRHAWYSAGRWYAETLDGECSTSTSPQFPVSQCTLLGKINGDLGADPTVTVWNNEPHVFYFDDTNDDLRHAWYVPAAGRWFFETLDGNSLSNGRVNGRVGEDSAALAWSSEPHVWYRDGANGDLRHAWWSGSKWNYETLDGQCSTSTSPQFPVSQCTLLGKVNGDVGSENAVTVFDGTPHVWYHDATNDNLRHAWWGGTRWYWETLDGAGGPGGRIDGVVGIENSVLAWSTQLHVWYSDQNNGDLRHAWYG